ncbi:MraY family glycosyltransferase [uncultured Bacteroides sp.]|uniref:MraY family glycosyltransferase n=1 Tax=uncultured Bacteroides sp. TaxID=162156 RepID=UPI002AAC3940|nr:MraY family glycosyltransferase [uncultured Bacteroides sp.]
MDEYKICIAFILFGFTLSFGMESFILPRIILISKERQLFDIPNERKQHEAPVPRLGGLSFLPVLFLTSIITIYIRCQLVDSTISPAFYDTLSDFMMLISGLLVLYIVGIKDDLSGVNYKKKFIMQFIASIFLILSGTYLNNLDGLFGIYEIPIWIGIPFTMLLCIFITNSINLIDGIDGLASGISATALIAYGYLFYISKQWIFSIICFTMLGVLIPFFYYNVFSSKNKIFMGDTGSLMLGFLLSFLGIRLAMDITDSSSAPQTRDILIAGSALFVPMFDTVKVMYARICVHRSLFCPDRKHIHHRLIDIGFSPRVAMIIIVSASIIMILTNFYALKYININIVFFADVITTYFVNKFITYLRYKKKKQIISLKFPKEDF